LSDAFHIQNGQKQGDTSSPLMPNFALKYDTRKVQNIRSDGDYIGHISFWFTLVMSNYWAEK